MGPSIPQPRQITPAINMTGVTVLQLIPELDTGGAERGCVDVAHAIHRAEGRAIVISAGGQMVRELEEGRGKHLLWSTIKSKNPLFIIWNGLKLYVLVKRHNINVVHVRSRAPAWSGLIGARLAGVPFVTTFHSTYNFNSGIKRLYNSVMARGDRVIAISDFIRRHILANYTTPAENICLIHRGVDIERYDPAQVSAARIDAVRAGWGVRPGQRVVLLPGRLTRWKGQSLLIDALPLMKDPNVVVVCAGSDQGRSDYRKTLQEQARQHDVHNRVLLPGDCTDMPAAYAAADVVVSASIEPEAFGRVIVEAQAMGKPVVVTDLGAVAETAGATGFGWIIPPNNPVALAKALNDALALPAGERAQRAAIARDYIAGHYTKARMCAATLAVYKELLESRR